MKTRKFILFGLLIVVISLSFLTMSKMNNNFKSTTSQKEYKIIFLHHSTGQVIYNAGNETNRIVRKLFPQKAYVSQWFADYNNANGTNYNITEQFFPKSKPYGWNNYPYDYYNIWVKNAGEQPYLGEPTLEILTKQYDLIIFKHCFPVSNIIEDINQPDINSPEKRIENYKLQYLALKQKLNEFPNTKFLVWTGAVQVESNTTKEQAQRAKDFFDWVKNDWDTADDNIFLWDFYELETEGGLFLKNENATNRSNSHPGKSFAAKAAPLFCQKIIEVIQHNSKIKN
jgi:hypothetical protein